MEKIKVGVIQLSIGNDIEKNREKLAAAIRRTAEQGAQLVILQELHNSPYFCQVESTANFSYAEPIPGPLPSFTARWQPSAK